jgi:hypothetical protein
MRLRTVVFGTAMLATIPLIVEPAASAQAATSTTDPPSGQAVVRYAAEVPLVHCDGTPCVDVRELFRDTVVTLNFHDMAIALHQVNKSSNS